MKKVDRAASNESNLLPVTEVSALGSEQRNLCGRILREYRLKAAMETAQLAQVIGCSKSAITNWEAGIRKPDLDTLGKLCRVLSIPTCLFFGIPHEAMMAKDEIALMNNYRSLNKYNKRTAVQTMQILLDSQIKALHENIKERFIRIEQEQLPASAGTGVPLDNIEAPEYVYVHVSREACMADEIIAVSGDSMQPTFNNGDLLLVERASEIEPGEIGIFIVAGDGFVKEYQPDGLHSHNPKYHTICPSEDDNTRCIGRVLGAVSPDQLATPEEYDILSSIYQDEDE